MKCSNAVESTTMAMVLLLTNGLREYEAGGFDAYVDGEMQCASFHASLDACVVEMLPSLNPVAMMMMVTVGSTAAHLVSKTGTTVRGMS